MNTTTNLRTLGSVAPLPIIAAALIGAALVFTAGLAQSGTLHDAAHDVRHATGFPCH